MITRIFSRSMNAGHYTLEGVDYSTLVWFPEIRYNGPGGAAPSAVHPADQIAAAHRLIGKSVVTLSEYIILWFLREITEGRMEPHEVELYCDGIRMEIDDEGDFRGWPGGFYRERADLLFGSGE